MSGHVRRNSRRIAPIVIAVTSPGMELTARFSAADDALAIWAQDEVLDGPDIDNALVHCDSTSRGDGEVWIYLTGGAATVTVTAQYFASPPPPIGPEWEDVVELSVVAGAPLVITELVEREPTALTPRPGAFRLRVAAAGRGPKAHETYLIQAWPAGQSPAEVIRLNSTFAASLEARDQLERHAAPVKEAAARIGADVDGRPGARRLSGRTGTLTVTRVIGARRRKLFSYLQRDLVGWGGTGGPLPQDLTFVNFPPLDGSEPLCGQAGALRRVRLEEVSPRLRVQSFVWLRGQPGVMLADSTHQFPEQGTVVSTTWDEQRDPNGLVRTTLTVTHSGLPVEWLKDMETWWSQQLAWIDWHARFRR